MKIKEKESSNTARRVKYSEWFKRSVVQSMNEGY